MSQAQQSQNLSVGGNTAEPQPERVSTAATGNQKDGATSTSGAGQYQTVVEEYTEHYADGSRAEITEFFVVKSDQDSTGAGK